MSFYNPDESHEMQQWTNELRLRRIKETKEMEREWSLEIVKLYKEYQRQLQRQNEFKEAIETYMRLLKEIEELKSTKEILIEEKRLNELSKEKEEQLHQEYLLRLEQKKHEFDLFMKQKGKEALNYLKKMKETKEKLDEELHRYEAKRRAKEASDLNSKKVVDKYRVYEEKLRKEEEEFNQKPNAMNILYTMTTPFHGVNCCGKSKIDYSNTRFHNITVISHENDINSQIHFKENAFEKAKAESEKTRQNLEEKKEKLKKFNKTQQQNFRDEIRRHKAKENLDRLNKEFERINKMKNERRNRSKSSSKKMISHNSNVNNAKINEKCSEKLMEKMIEQQKKNRNKIFGGRNFSGNKGNVVKLNEPGKGGKKERSGGKELINKSQVTDEEMRAFYGEAEDTNSLINKEKFFLKEIEAEEARLARENKQKNNKYFYQEPISREVPTLKESINRLSPVDLTSYQKVENDNEFDYIHDESKVKCPSFRIKKPIPPKDNVVYDFEHASVMNNHFDFDVLKALKIKNDGDNNNIDNNFNNNKTEIKHISNKGIYNSKSSIKSNSEKTDKFTSKFNSNSKCDANNVNNDDSKIIDNYLKNIEERKESLAFNDDPVSSFLEQIKKSKPLEKKTGEIIILDNNKSKGKNDDKNVNSLNTNKVDLNTMNIGDNVSSSSGLFISNNNLISSEKDNLKVEDRKNNDKKWKMSKQELYERKKKMLKDKSNFK